MRAFSPGVWAYYVLIVGIGGFFVVNLFLAVIFQVTPRWGPTPWVTPRWGPTPWGDTPLGPHPHPHPRAVILQEFIAAQQAGDDGAQEGGAPPPSARSERVSHEQESLLEAGELMSDGTIRPPPRHCCDCSVPVGQGGWRKQVEVFALSDGLGNFSTG